MMSNRTKRWISIGFGVYSAIIAVAYIIFLLANSKHIPEVGIQLAEFADGLISTVTLAFLGFLLSYRRPENRISWLLVLIALMRQTSYLFTIARIINLGEIDSSFWPIIGNLWPSLSALTFTLLAYVIVLFPTGRLPSSKWRFTKALLCLQTAFTVGLFLLLSYDLDRSIHEIFDSGGEIILVPIGLSGPPALYSHVRQIPGFSNYSLVRAAIALIMVLFGLWSQVIQYRDGTKIIRQQIKWVMFVVALWAIALILIFSPVGIPFTSLIFVAPLIPVSIAVAILRYRLYDIDLIIRRTAVYAIITGLLVVIYFGSVTLMQNLVSIVSGQESPIAIVISTLIIAAIFNPLRRRVQDFIDRRFYRQKYNTEQTLSVFAETARDEVNLDALTAELTSTIHKTLQPESVSLWLSPKQENDR